MNIGELLNRAFALWAKITDTDPQRTSFKLRFRFSGEEHEWDQMELTRLAKDLHATFQLDTTGLSSFMLLRGAAEDYLAATQINALRFLNDPEGVEKQIQPMRELRELLETGHAVLEIDDFIDRLRAAAVHHGMSEERRAKLEKLLSHKLLLAYVRRDALRSLERLEASQFCHGEPGTEPLRMNPTIYEFWNIQSLLHAMKWQTVSGITLCLLRDPHQGLFSHFAIAIRNGESLTVLTDRQHFATPEGAIESADHRRWVQRSYLERAGLHRFPYELLLRKIDEEEKRHFRGEVTSTALAPVQTHLHQLGTIADMEPDCFVWWLLLSELLAETYGRQNKELPEPSFTSEMIEEPYKLVDSQSALMRRGDYQPLRLETLHHEDVTHETTASQWATSQHRHGHNQWLMERYAPQVPESLFNPFVSTTTLALEAESGQPSKTLRSAWMNYGSVREGKERLSTMQPTWFGTKTELERDRLWYARRNQVKAVQHLALEEFDREVAATMEWFRARVEARAEWFIDALVRGSCVIPARQLEKSNGHNTWSRKLVLETREALVIHGETPHRSRERIPAFRKVTDPFMRQRPAALGRGVHTSQSEGWVGIFGGRDDAGFTCYVEPKYRANVLAHFEPVCAQGVAALLGLESVDELPWSLRNWLLAEPYTGNPGLERVDPEESALVDPWRALQLRVLVCLSRSVFGRRRKELGLPPKQWKQREEKETT